jgi:putative ABC transport system permease protein
MQFWEGVRLAMVQISTQRLKSFFSVLGVIIGVMFLIVVVSVVEGMDRYIKEDLSSQIFGVNTVTVRRTPQVNINVDPEEWRRRARRPRITEADAEAIRAALTYPARVGVQSGGGGEVTADNGRSATNVQLIGVSPEIFIMRNWVIDRGRGFSAQEAARGVPVVVLGSQTADVLFEGIDPIGRTVRVQGFPYRVIGVLEEKGTLFGQSLDNQLVAPARSPIRSLVAARGYVDEVLVQAIEANQVRSIQAEVEGVMRVRHRLRPSEPNDFAAETADDSLSFWDRISTILFTALPGLVAISLVVGGIVIMNIMLVSVMERTREIGVRKALGARRRDILSQVLVESATLSTLGALAGVGLGVGLAAVVRAVSPLPAVVAPQWVTLGVVLGITVGVVAGVYPAAQASKLDPVDALRYE